MMIQKIKVHSLLDCRGLYCPVPVANAREEIDKLEPGKILQIIVDDIAAEEDIPRWAKRTGHTLLDKWKQGNDLYFIIRKEKTKDEISQYFE
ncbi:MAG: sulfurtransferase TusA family protein [Candidatus Hodarchaeota archaeon]